MNYKTPRHGLLLLLIVVGLGIVVALSRWLDAHRRPIDTKISEEQLYLNGATMKRVSLGFNGLAADWYWMRSLQYVGGRVMNVPSSVPIDSLGQLDLKLLAPLLDAATTLDPQFMEPYEYAAVVLPNIDLQQAIRITQKGIAANPTPGGFISISDSFIGSKKICRCGEAYAQGARLPGAPPWMEAMKARMAAEGGSRKLAKEIYGRLYEQAEDGQVKEMARLRLLNLASLDDREVLLRLLANFKRRPVAARLRGKRLKLAASLNMNLDSNGAPLDPGGTPYLLMSGSVTLSGSGIESSPSLTNL